MQCRRPGFNPWVWKILWRRELCTSNFPLPPLLSLFGNHKSVFFFFYVYESVSVLYIDSFVLGFPGGSDGKECACSAEDSGSIPGLRRSLGEGNGYLLQYSCLEDSKQKGVWQPTVHVAKS